MAKALFITDENFETNTGGVIYARNVISGLQPLFDDLLVFSSSLESSEATFRKTEFNTYISRVFLQSSPLIFSAQKILKLSKTVDNVYLHSSKHWFIALLLKCFGPPKKIFCISDNIEFDLMAYKLPLYKYAPHNSKVCIEKCLRYLSEAVCFHLSDSVTFVTRADYLRSRQLYKTNFECTLLPIAVTNKKNSYHSACFCNLLFSGSFSFDPNIEAFNKLISMYPLFKKLRVNVTIAGYNLDKLVEKNSCLSLTDVFNFYSSPSSSQMDDIFSSADLFVSPVSSGSGMKTKIAECLSYGLPCIASEKSVVGYEDISGRSNWLVVIDDEFDMFEETFMQFINDEFLPNDFMLLKDLHRKFYSLKNSEYILRGVSL